MSVTANRTPPAWQRGPSLPCQWLCLPCDLLRLRAPAPVGCAFPIEPTSKWQAKVPPPTPYRGTWKAPSAAELRKWLHAEGSLYVGASSGCPASGPGPSAVRTTPPQRHRAPTTSVFGMTSEPRGASVLSAKRPSSCRPGWPISGDSETGPSKTRSEEKCHRC